MQHAKVRKYEEGMLHPRTSRHLKHHELEMQTAPGVSKLVLYSKTCWTCKYPRQESDLKTMNRIQKCTVTKNAACAVMFSSQDRKWTYCHPSSTCTPIDWNLANGGGVSSRRTSWIQSTWEDTRNNGVTKAKTVVNNGDNQSKCTSGTSRTVRASVFSKWWTK